MRLSVPEIQRVLYNLEQLYDKPLDDCMWMPTEVRDELVKQCEVTADPRLVHALSLCGIKVFIDDELQPGEVQTGTIKIVDGELKRIVRHTFYTKRRE